MSDAHGATQYAEDVVAGNIVTSMWAKLACERHLRDLEDARSGKKGWLAWSEAEVDDAFEFITNFITVENQTLGKRVPFDPLPWQRFILGNVFGWRLAEGNPWGYQPGTRRFRSVFIEGAKGAGKTPLTSSIMFYIMTADPMATGRAFILAPSQQQCDNARGDLVETVKGNKSLAKLWEFNESKQITRGHLTRTDKAISISTFVAGNHQLASGLRPVVVMADEFGEYGSRKSLDVFVEGFKGARQPLALIATNAGTAQHGPCWEEHQDVQAILSGDRKDDTSFGIIYSVDDGDKPLADPKCWVKANPSIGAIVERGTIKQRADKAKRGTREAREATLQLQFGIWPTISSDWLTEGQWRPNVVEKLPAAELEGLPCFLGLDLSNTRDLTSLAQVWRDGSRLWARVLFWSSKVNLEQRSERFNNYLLDWADKGHIRTSEGDAVSYREVAEEVKGMQDEGGDDLVALAFDDWNIPHFKKALDEVGVRWYDGRPWEDQGLALIDHPQGAQKKLGKRPDGTLENPLTFTTSFRTLESCLLGVRDAQGNAMSIRVEANPVLHWNINAVKLAPVGMTGTLLPHKRKSRENRDGSIDGVVALTQAVGLAMQDWDRERVTDAVIGEMVQGVFGA